MRIPIAQHCAGARGRVGELDQRHARLAVAARRRRVGRRLRVVGGVVEAPRAVVRGEGVAPVAGTIEQIARGSDHAKTKMKESIM